MLHIIEKDAPAAVTRGHRALTLQVRPGATWEDKHAVIEKWYRDEVRSAAVPLRSKWESYLGVVVRQIFVQHMRTKWGSCYPTTGNIRLNTDLAKKPPECLDYVVLHELAHLRERTHSPEFYTLLDQALPQWRSVRQMLNDLPLRTDIAASPY